MQLNSRSILIGLAVSVAAVLTAVKTTEQPNAAVATILVTPTIETANHEQLSATLLKQLDDAGIARPQKTDLFPQDPDSLYRDSRDFNRWLGRLIGVEGMAAEMSEGQAAYDTNTDANSVTGISRDGDVRYEMVRHLEKSPYSGACTSLFEQNFEGFRNMVALHEMSHYIDTKLGLAHAIVSDLTKYIDVDGQNDYHGRDPIFVVNIRERIADASAVIYILSNYAGTPLATQLVDWRQANLEGTHFTSSTVSLAIDHFKENPRAGMTLVETTKMAADIISGQPKLWKELDLLTEANLELRNGVKPPSGLKGHVFYDPETYKDIQSMEAAARTARDRLCRRPLSSSYVIAQ